jgi:hypothetical protein
MSTNYTSIIFLKNGTPVVLRNHTVDDSSHEVVATDGAIGVITGVKYDSTWTPDGPQYYVQFAEGSPDCYAITYGPIHRKHLDVYHSDEPVKLPPQC